MESHSSESDPALGRPSTTRVVAQRLNVRVLAGGLLLLAALASFGYSLYCFYTSLESRAQVRQMQKDLAELQRQRQSPAGKEAEGVMTILGMLGGVGPGEIDLLGTTGLLAYECAALSAEKSAFQYLCLALAFGFPGLWLAWSSWRGHSGPNKALQPTGPA